MIVFVTTILKIPFQLRYSKVNRLPFVELLMVKIIPRKKREIMLMILPCMWVGQTRTEIRVTSLKRVEISTWNKKTNFGDDISFYLNGHIYYILIFTFLTCTSKKIQFKLITLRVLFSKFASQKSSVKQCLVLQHHLNFSVLH